MSGKFHSPHAVWFVCHRTSKSGIWISGFTQTCISGLLFLGARGYRANRARHLRLNFIRTVRSRTQSQSIKSGIRWTGYVALLVEIGTAQKSLGEKPEGWGSVSRCRCKNSIKVNIKHGRWVCGLGTCLFFIFVC